MDETTQKFVVSTAMRFYLQLGLGEDAEPPSGYERVVYNKGPTFVAVKPFDTDVWEARFFVLGAQWAYVGSEFNVAFRRAVTRKNDGPRLCMRRLSERPLGEISTIIPNTMVEAAVKAELALFQRPRHRSDPQGARRQ